MSSRPKPASKRARAAPPAADGALVDALAQTAFTVMSVLSRIGAEHGLSLTQMRVFGVLRDRRPRMAELAGYLGLDKSTMSGLVDRAVQRGLIAREQSPDDARAFDVYLTTAGKQAAARVHAAVTQALAPLMDRLDPDGRRGLTGLLEQLLDPQT